MIKLSAQRIRVPVFCAALALSGAARYPANAAAPPTSSTLVTTYTNPLDFTIADPFVLRTGDSYLMYGTTDETPGQGFDVFESPDLVTWNRAARAYTPGESSWGQGNFWAPEVTEKDGAYYLHYTAINREERQRNILIARAENPRGPFKDYAGPLVPEMSVIDSHIYREAGTGKYYFYFVPEHEQPQGIWVAELAPDFKSLLTSPTACLTSDLSWEDHWIEGPIIHEHKGTLYMMYSGGAYWEPEYALGYATATSPLGPWTKAPENPVLKRNRHREGTGHNGLAMSPDGTELFCVYHLHAGPWTTRRVAGLDRIKFVADKPASPDKLTMPGAPTWQPQPLPSGARPRRGAQSDEFSATGPDWNLWRVFNNYPRFYGQSDGVLEIKAQPGDVWRGQTSARNIFLQSAPTGDFTIETKVTMDARQHNEQAFLILWENQDNYITFAAAKHTGNKLVLSHERYAKVNTQLMDYDVQWPMHLKVQRRANRLQFFASKDGRQWDEFKFDADATEINLRDIGFGAWSPGVNRQTPAKFEWFRVSQ